MVFLSEFYLHAQFFFTIENWLISFIIAFLVAISMLYILEPAYIGNADKQLEDTRLFWYDIIQP